MTRVDLTTCDREPIHIPGSIQPHGALLCVRPGDGVIVQASDNLAAFLGPGRAPAQTLAELTGGDTLQDRLDLWWPSDEPSLFLTQALAGRTRNVVAHRSDGLIVLELEEASDAARDTAENLYGKLRGFLTDLPLIIRWQELCQRAAAEVQALTGFDRVLIYRFDEDWNGVVLAEANNGELPVYLDLRFPASDIPSQARELYRLNRVRIIPDAHYAPVPVTPTANPLTGRPLDLSFAVLRSVSPVHVEYMRNMKTDASMSVSIIADGRLWGLISCHHSAPRQVPIQVRNACDFLAQILALQLVSRIRIEDADRRIELEGVQGGLLARMSDAMVFADVLKSESAAWLGLADAAGAAFVSNDRLVTVGQTPADDDIRSIAKWLDQRDGGDVFATDALGSLMPNAGEMTAVASGLLAVSISELYPSYILWFRPEVVQTVTWAGDPTKPVSANDERLHPRQSFASWKEQVRGRSRPWQVAEIETAHGFREGVIQIVLRRAEERAQLTSDLERSNKELEAFSYSISHDLRAPFRHIVGYSELLKERAKTALDDKSRHYVDSIVEAAVSAGRLVDDLLNFSHLGRANLSRSRVDMNKLVAEVRRSLAPEAEGRTIRWEIGALPAAWGDPTLLRQVLMNLIDNAIKYTRPRDEAVISISGQHREGESLFTIKDNGVGFDIAYGEKMFGVFQRLQREEDFEGTGIGLALARRVIDRHGGRIWAEGELGHGASFFFSLPAQERKPIRG